MWLAVSSKRLACHAHVCRRLQRITLTLTLTLFECLAKNLHPYMLGLHNTQYSIDTRRKTWTDWRRYSNKKHLKNVGPIRHCEPPHALILHCHSPGVATVARRLRIDAYDDDDNNDNAWQREPLWPHGMGPKTAKFSWVMWEAVATWWNVLCGRDAIWRKLLASLAKRQPAKAIGLDAHSGDGISNGSCVCVHALTL